jgi:branched-chain amino acid transport system permease protein
LGLINFAHGDVLMVGALVALWSTKLALGFNPDLSGTVLLLIALAIAAPCCMVLSFVIERIAYRPLRNAPKLAPLITAIGVSITLQTVAMIIWGRNYHVFPQVIPSTPITLLSFSPIAAGDAVRTVTMTPTQLIIIILAALLMLGLTFLVNKTRLGRAMRATSENPKVAALMGVNPDRVISLTFMLGAALAAIAGIMVACNYSIAHFYMGFIPGLKAFTAAVLGGIGNVYGAMLGGILLGLVESLGAGYIGDLTGGFFSSNYQDIFAFLVLIFVLTLKPTGLLGERVADRA